MLKQQLSTAQRQKLSPTQYQVIRMLGYSTAEMEEVINKELEANPALEEQGDISQSDREFDTDQQEDFVDNNTDTSNESSVLTDDLDIMEADSYDDYQSDYVIVNNFNSDKDTPPSQGFSAEESFQENLFAQLDETSADEWTKNLARYIIGNLDENGYLTRNIVNISDDLAFSMGIEATESQLNKALYLVQSLEPAGIGAKDLQECLKLQINRKKSTPSIERAKEIIEHYFDKFTEKRYAAIKAKLNITDREFDDALDEILRLNPKPGNELGQSKSEEFSSQIIPDFTVEHYNDNLYVSLNRFNYPKLSVSEAYKDMLNDLSENKNKNAQIHQAISFTRKKIDEANIFIEAIKQRNLTLIRTMIAIANRQRAFFVSGDDTTLVPMKLKDISEIINYDQSTISRATNNKYVQTEYGVFPLRYFFSEAIKTDGGEEVSNKKVKSIIRDIINNEDKEHPFTDDQITDILGKEGYRIARRTIAKYREELQIPTSNQRMSYKN